MSAFIDSLSRWVSEIFKFVYLASVCIIGLEVVLRYVFNAPTVWAHEMVITLTAIGFVMGGVTAMRTGAHVRINVVQMVLPRPIQRLMDKINHVVMVAYLLVFSYACYNLAARSWQTMETSGSAWNQPTPVVMKTALVVGAVLVLLQVISHLVQVFQNRAVPGTSHEPQDV